MLLNGIYVQALGLRHQLTYSFDRHIVTHQVRCFLVQIQVIVWIQFAHSTSLQEMLGLQDDNQRFKASITAVQGK